MQDVARPQGNPGAAWSIVAGLLSVAVMPVAIGLTRYSADYDLLHSFIAAPLGLFLGAVGVGLSRKARARLQLSLGRAGGSGSLRAGRVLSVLGICLACAAGIAIGVYGLLTYLGTR